MAPHRSPELRETLTDAAAMNEEAFGKPTGALTDENERADEFIRLIDQYLYRSRMRMVDMTASAEAGAPDERA